jgi:hypothetical protein
VICWGTGLALVRKGDRVDMGGKRESRRVETASCGGVLSGVASRGGEEAPRSRGGEALVREAASSVGDCGNVLMGEPGWLS